MPNRIIRESALTSATLYRISDFGERLFWRLTLIADDFGRYESEAQVIKAKCFPLWPDRRLPLTKIVTSYNELEAADLVKTYIVDGKRYGFFVTWEKYQQRRASRSKYPDPTEDNIMQAPANVCLQMLSNVPEKREARSEESRSDHSVGLTPDAAAPESANGNYRQDAIEVLTWLNEKAGKRFELVPVNLEMIEARLREGRPAWLLKKMVSVKAKQWPKGHEQHEYLRPATLFNRTKCAQYIGQLPVGTEVAE